MHEPSIFALGKDANEPGVLVQAAIHTRFVNVEGSRLAQHTKIDGLQLLDVLSHTAEAETVISLQAGWWFILVLIVDELFKTSDGGALSGRRVQEVVKLRDSFAEGSSPVLAIQ